jgi:hypothetical protein
MSIQKSSNILRPFLFLVLVFLVLGSVGCGSDDSPTAPANNQEDPPVDEEEILTPKQIRITSIRLDAFDERKESGATWDASLRVAPRRPDVFVTLQTGSVTSAPIFVSITRDDAFSGAGYDMSESDAGTGLPKTVFANRMLTVSVYDYDGPTANDYIGGASTTPIDNYRDNNAQGFTWTFNGSGGTKVRVSGDWIY